MAKKIFIIVGRSGSGKDTIVKELLKKIPSLNRVIPITTRPKRENEKYGEDYFFISKENMLKLIDNKELLEYRKYDVINTEGKEDVWYYAHEKPNKDNSIIIGTPALVDSLLLMNLHDYTFYPIFINVDEEELLYRSILREEQNSIKNWKELVRRFFKDRDDFERFDDIDLDKRYKYFINKDLNECVEKISSYIEGGL